MDVTPCRATVTVVVPVQAEQLPALPVIVAEPMVTPVAKPPAVMETALESLEDQVTPEVSCFWLPSVYVPVADIWMLWLSVRVACGPIVTPVSVGFTKNPRQLAAKANVASAANAPINRSFCIFEDIIIRLPGRARSGNRGLNNDSISKIVAEKIGVARGL